MKSRIDIVTEYGIIGLEVRENLESLVVQSYNPEIGHIVFYPSKEIICSSPSNLPNIGEAKKYMKKKALAVVPLYLFENRIMHSLAVRTSKKSVNGERLVLDDVCGYLYLSENDLAIDTNETMRQFFICADKTAKEFSNVLNRDVFEYQIYLNFKPITPPSKRFYGNYLEVMKKIKRDFIRSMHHPAFAGDGGLYLFEHIKYEMSIADIWILAPEEHGTITNYLYLCINRLEKDMAVCM